jgi:hypothetical protein
MLEMINVEEASHIIEAAVSTGLPTWIGYSCMLSDDGSEVLLLHSEDETLIWGVEVSHAPWRLTGVCDAY